MKHAVIVAHPHPKSFNLSVAGVYAKAVTGQGGEALVPDLYRMGFNPCLQAGEVPHAEGFHPEPDVITERALLADVKVFTLVYPLWFNASPAMLKRYLDQVFGMGFGYGPVLGGGNLGLLTGRRLVSISTYGAPSDWIRKEGSLDALHNLFDIYFAGVCCLVPVEHLHFGGITQGMRDDAARSILNDIAAAAARLFPAEAA